MHGLSPELHVLLAQVAMVLLVCMCCMVLAHTLPALDDNHTKLLWTFFQPLAPPLLMLWLWMHTVQYFELKNIQYAACFAPKHRKYLVPHTAIYQVRDERRNCSHVVLHHHGTQRTRAIVI